MIDRGVWKHPLPLHGQLHTWPHSGLVNGHPPGAQGGPPRTWSPPVHTLVFKGWQHRAEAHSGPQRPPHSRGAD